MAVYSSKSEVWPSEGFLDCDIQLIDVTSKCVDAYRVALHRERVAKAQDQAEM